MPTTMPPAKKRKIAPTTEIKDSDAQDQAVEGPTSSDFQQTQNMDESSEPGSSAAMKSEVSSVDKNRERQERFKALQARSVRSH